MGCLVIGVSLEDPKLAGWDPCHYFRRYLHSRLTAQAFSRKGAMRSFSRPLFTNGSQAINKPLSKNRLYCISLYWLGITKVPLSCLRRQRISFSHSCSYQHMPVWLSLGHFRAILQPRETPNFQSYFT